MDRDTATPAAACPQCLNYGGCPYCLGSDPDCQSCLGKNMCPNCLRSRALGSPADLCGAVRPCDPAAPGAAPDLPSLYSAFLGVSGTK